MTDPITQLAIDDIGDLADGMARFAPEDGDALEISLMDVVIAVISRP